MPESSAPIRTGLIGRNIGASRSPWLHEQEARAQSLDLRYDLLDFSAMGKDERDLPAQLERAEAEGFSGLNVTYPYKQAIIAFLTELSPGAARVGAVNTVRFTQGRRIGYNTDVTGFGESVRAGLPGASLRSVLQLGAGGAGAATAMALLELGVQTLHVSDHDEARATELVGRLCTEFGAGCANVTVDPGRVLRDVDGLVNATPMGMLSSPGAPIDTSLLEARQWVADIVYFPLETTLLREARRRGCATLDGSGMAVYQAAAAFQIFTGRIPDVPRMLASFKAAVKPS